MKRYRSVVPGSLEHRGGGVWQVRVVFDSGAGTAEFSEFLKLYKAGIPVAADISDLVTRSIQIDALRDQYIANLANEQQVSISAPGMPTIDAPASLMRRIWEWIASLVYFLRGGG